MEDSKVCIPQQQMRQGRHRVCLRKETQRGK